MIKSKSCFNCKHIQTNHYYQTHEEPESSDWECGHKDLAQFPPPVENEWDCKDDDELARCWAKNCPGYESFDWDGYHRQQAESEAQLEMELRLTPKQEQELREIAQEVERDRLIEIGHMTPDGELTDAYYRAADFAYDCYKERHN